ncbi:sialidase family protein [Lentimicrobium sp. S6]|uniref:sialidase family protein n=1 Tax=Lentimicrobium sp. S6 TaxID=2735872 RepID=UPI001552814A|nr:sialidase family protein [Lentimicrobium sp. S6]NPD47278.1 exo-alpha-sialidase [Lentimicrobium sp. S6]
MKVYFKFLVLSLFLGSIMISCNQNKINDSQNELKDLNQGPYLDMKPPGLTAELFAPGIVSTGLSVRSIAVMPDGKEIYFSVVDGNIPIITICFTKLVDGKWTKPEVAPFATNRDFFYFEHHITPDGKKLMFSSTKPIEGELAKPGFEVENIWVVDREGKGWGEPYDIGSPINTQQMDFFPSSTHDGTLYFSRHGEGGENLTMYRTQFVNGKYAELEKLPLEINDGKYNSFAYIAPDESYLVLRHWENKDSVEYYVSFRNEKNEWSETIRLDERVNRPNSVGNVMSVSSDGKYLFFFSKLPVDINELFSGPTTYKDILNTLTSSSNGSSNIYWVDAKIIDEFRPEN